MTPAGSYPRVSMDELLKNRKLFHYFMCSTRNKSERLRV